MDYSAPPLHPLWAAQDEEGEVVSQKQKELHTLLCDAVVQDNYSRPYWIMKVEVEEAILAWQERWSGQRLDKKSCPICGNRRKDDD